MVSPASPSPAPYARFKFFPLLFGGSSSTKLLILLRDSLTRIPSIGTSYTSSKPGTGFRFTLRGDAGLCGLCGGFMKLMEGE